MLTGQQLGEAIKTAIDLKIASGSARSKAEIARHFGVQPPSIHDWIKRGVIGKDKLPELFRYFSDVVGPDHWGLQPDSWPDHPHSAHDSNTEPGPTAPFDPATLTRSQQDLWRSLLESLPRMDDQMAEAIRTLVSSSQKGGKTAK